MKFIPFECSGFANAVVAAGTLIDGTLENVGAVNVQVSLLSVKQPTFGQAAVEATVSVEDNEVPIDESMARPSAPNIGKATVDMGFDTGANEKLPIDAVNVEVIN